MLMRRSMALDNLSKTIPPIGGITSYRRGGRDRDQSIFTPSATVTKPCKSGDGHATMTVTVPEDSNKHKVQINEGAPRAKRPPMPPTQNQCQSGGDYTCGGVEVCNEPSLCVKYRSQGVQTLFNESTPSAQDPPGKYPFLRRFRECESKYP